VRHAVERRLQRGELGVAADHAGLHAFDAARRHPEGAGLGAQHEIAAHRCLDALHRERRLRLDVEDAAHVAVGVVADPQRAGRRGLLHARRDVDRLAADAALLVDAAAEQHAAGVDADAHAGASEAMRRLDLGAQRGAELEQGEAAADRALGIVLGGLVGAERGEQVVAGVLQNLAAVRRDDPTAARQHAVHHRGDRLGVEVLAERGGADHVEKEDADLAERLGRLLRGLAQRREPSLQAAQCHVDHLVAELPALCLERDDARLEPLLLR
jgi:hypothetical protein